MTNFEKTGHFFIVKDCNTAQKARLRHTETGSISTNKD